MNNTLMNFNFENNTVRFVEDKEKKFDFGIVVKDLAVCLGYVRKDGKTRTDTLDELVDEDYKGTAKIGTPGGTQSMKVFWEPGLYQALGKSEQPKAKPFQKKLYEKVLPEIRKTGGYNLQEKFDIPQDYASALRLAANEYERRLQAEEKAKETQGKLNEAEDVLETYRSILSPESCLTVGQVAQALGITGLGRNNMFKYLRRKDFIKQKPSQEPYQKRIDEELAVVDLLTIKVGHKEVTKPQTKLTFKGLEWLIKKLKASKFSVNTSAKAVWDYYNAQ